MSLRALWWCIVTCTSLCACTVGWVGNGDAEGDTDEMPTGVGGFEPEPGDVEEPPPGSTGGTDPVAPPEDPGTAGSGGGTGTGSGTGTATGTGTGTGSGGDSSTVCFPGPFGAYDACLPLVDWSASWGSDYAYASHSSDQYRKPLRFIDLSSADSDLAIAENFLLSEVLQEWKGRFGVYQPHVVAKLQQIRDTTGGSIVINSAYRSPAYNSSVGGATYSRHMYGDAVDMKSNVVSLSELRSICEGLGAGYTGTYTTFIHCDWRNDPLDSGFFASGTIRLGGPDDAGATMPEHTTELVQAVDGMTWTAPATGFDEGEPLRTWTAYDSAGEVIETVDVGEYEPPAEAVRIHVEVGGNVEAEVELGL